MVRSLTIKLRRTDARNILWVMSHNPQTHIGFDQSVDKASRRTTFLKTQLTGKGTSLRIGVVKMHRKREREKDHQELTCLISTRKVRRDSSIMQRRQITRQTKNKLNWQKN